MHSPKLYLSPGVPASVWGQKLTTALLWAITVSWLAIYILGLAFEDFTLARLYQNPLVGIGRGGLLRIGATSTHHMQHHGEWWRLAASPFVSAGAIHFSANMATLWTFGLFLATSLHAWQLLFIILVSGAGGSCVSANLSLEHVTSAASAPAFGLLGGTVAALLLHRRLFVHHFSSFLIMALTLLLNLFVGATPFADNVCNIAGFVCGGLATLGFLLIHARGFDSTGKEWSLRLMCALLLGASILIPVVAVLGLNLNTPLAGCCDEVICTPNRLWDCEASRLPQSCEITRPLPTTSVITCPDGISSYTFTGQYTDGELLQLCAMRCNATGSGDFAATATGSNDSVEGRTGANMH